MFDICRLFCRYRKHLYEIKYRNIDTNSILSLEPIIRRKISNKILMDSGGIRIKLNLTEFFNDKRKYSYIFIEENKIKDFFDLESRIRDEFGIRGNIIFLIDNVFVPHSESIKLLHEEETLTLSADTVGLNYLRTKYSQNFPTKYAREGKRKKKIDQPEDETGENGQYFQPEDDCALVTQGKKKKIQTSKGNVSQNVLYSYSDICAIEQETVTDEIHQSENEMFLKSNEVYNLKHECEETPTVNKKKRDKKVKNRPIISVEQINSECKTISTKDYSQINYRTANEKRNIHIPEYIKQDRETSRRLSGDIKENKKVKKQNKTETHEVNYVYPTGKFEDHSKEEMPFDDAKEDGNELIVQLNNETNLNENREYLNNKETSISDKGCNPVLNTEPMSTDAGNIENCSHDGKRRRVRTRKRKKNDPLSSSGSQNTTGPCTELDLSSIPVPNHIRFADEISEKYITDTTSEVISVKGNLNQFNDSVKQRNVYINSGDNGLNEPVHSTEVSQTPTKSEVCLSTMMTPTPVDTFHKLLSLKKHSSTPFVFNRALSNSNTFQKITTENKCEEKPEVINSENVDCITVENYPLINSFPKEGDVLAFKLYRMASDYTPRITDYIIATVLQYCVNTCQITVNVQRGLDQLREPQGRFSLLEDSEELCDQNDTYDFNWNELMETRLLFP